MVTGSRELRLGVERDSLGLGINRGPRKGTKLRHQALMVDVRSAGGSRLEEERKAGVDVPRLKRVRNLDQSLVSDLA